MYCTSLYGCELWDLFCEDFFKLLTSWNIYVRKAWDVPRSTHRRFIAPLSGCKHTRTLIFSSALCYGTAELLSSRSCPSVKLIFSEPVKQINAKFGGQIPFHGISPDHFFILQNFAFFIFYEFFSFLLTWESIWEKKLQTTSPEST